MKKVELYFEPVEHKYTDAEGNVYTSVTTLIGQITPEYPARFWAMYRALDQTGIYKLRPDPDSDKILVDGKWYTTDELYQGIIKTNKTPQQITKGWKSITQRSLDRGNKTHDYLENCINDFYGKDKNCNTFEMSDVAQPTFKFKIEKEAQLDNSPLQSSHKTVYDTLKKMLKAGYVLYAEKRVYSYEHKVSGTIDVLAVRSYTDDKGKIHRQFWIVDWKTNKDILKFKPGYYKKEWNADRTEKVKTDKWVDKDERYNYPLHTLQISKGMGYAIQLSIYAYICELWGLECQGLILFHLRETDEKVYPPRYYGIKYLKHEIELLMDWKLQKQLFHESFK